MTSLAKATEVHSPVFRRGGGRAGCDEKLAVRSADRLWFWPRLLPDPLRLSQCRAADGLG